MNESNPNNIRNQLEKIINKKNIDKKHPDLMNCLFNCAEYKFIIQVVQNPNNKKSNLYFVQERKDKYPPLFFYDLSSGEVMNILESNNNTIVNLSQKIKSENEIIKDYQFDKRNRILLFKYLKFPLNNLEIEDNSKNKNITIFLDEENCDYISTFSNNSFSNIHMNYSLLFDIYNINNINYLFSIDDIKDSKELKFKWKGSVHGKNIFKTDIEFTISPNIIIDSIKSKMIKYMEENKGEEKIENFFEKYFFTKLNNDRNDIGILFSARKKDTNKDTKILSNEYINKENWIINKFFFCSNFVANNDRINETKDTTSTYSFHYNYNKKKNFKNENFFKPKEYKKITNLYPFYNNNSRNEFSYGKNNRKSKIKTNERSRGKMNLNYLNEKIDRYYNNTQNFNNNFEDRNKISKEEISINKDKRSFLLDMNDDFISELFSLYKKGNCISNFIILKEKISLKFNIEMERLYKIKLKYFFDIFKDINNISLNIPLFNKNGKIFLNELNCFLSSFRLVLKIDKGVIYEKRKDTKSSTIKIKEQKENIIVIEYEETIPFQERKLLYTKIDEIKKLIGNKNYIIDNVMQEHSYFCVYYNINNKVINSSFLAYYSFDFKLIGILIIKLDSEFWLTSFSNICDNYIDFKEDYNENVRNVKKMFNNLGINKSDGYYHFYTNDYAIYSNNIDK